MMKDEKTSRRAHSVAQFAAIAGIGVSKVWAHVREGDIPVVYFGRCPKIADETVERILRDGLPRLPARKRRDAAIIRRRTEKERAKRAKK